MNFARPLSFTIGLTSFLAVLCTLMAHAQAVPAKAERVQIIPDQTHGAVTITIDGVPALRVTKAGIEVSGSVVYSGSMIYAPVTKAGPDER